MIEKNAVFYVFIVKIEKGLNLVGGHLCEAAMGELAREPLLGARLTSARVQNQTRHR
jgi:hypothetical protein